MGTTLLSPGNPPPGHPPLPQPDIRSLIPSGPGTTTYTHAATCSPPSRGHPGWFQHELTCIENVHINLSQGFIVFTGAVTPEGVHPVPNSHCGVVHPAGPALQVHSPPEHPLGHGLQQHAPPARPAASAPCTQVRAKGYSGKARLIQPLPRTNPCLYVSPWWPPTPPVRSSGGWPCPRGAAKVRELTLALCSSTAKQEGGGRAFRPACQLKIC